MLPFFSIVHIVLCVLLVLVILLQVGKGADMGAVFGGSSQTLFGTTGATTFLTKLTAACAILFVITSLYLTAKSRATVIKGDVKLEQPAQNIPLEAPTSETPQNNNEKKSDK